MAASPQNPLPAPTQGTEPPASPQGCAQGLGKPSGRCAGKSQSTQPPSFAAPLTHVCVHSAPPHTRVHHSARATACPAPQPPQPSVCPLPAPTEHPSLPPPPERFRSVSIDKSGALPRRRCNGAQRVRGCRGAQAHSGAGGAGWIHAWDCTHVTSQVCGCTGVGFPGCVVAHVCARCRRRVCTHVRVCTHARTDVCSACAGLWGLGDPTLGQRWQTGPSALSGSSCSSAGRETEAVAAWDSPCQGRSLGDGGTSHCHHL